MLEVDLFSFDLGAVVAPAGCGKTHLIAETIKHYSGTKPLLILTHTNAGVVALRGRLDAAGVPTSNFRLSTIDGWAIRLVSTFPVRSSLNPELLKLSSPATDYPNIRAAAVRLVRDNHIGDVLKASYAGLVVDEYQDCSLRQHALIAFASTVLPTRVLGDPLQAIFGFGQDGLANWDGQVCARFPVRGQLATPWRWINAGNESLGRWLLEIRQALLRGDPIDLQSAPNTVRWVELNGADDHARRLEAARVRAPNDDGRVLIIGESTSPESQRRFASQTPGAVTVEAVDLRDLVSFARSFDLASTNALQKALQFAESVMTNVGGNELLRRLASIRTGTARNPPTVTELAAQRFSSEPSHSAAVDLLVELGKQAGVRTYRPAVLRSCIKALNLCRGTHGLSFYDAAIRMREQNRLVGRPLPKRAVGSTLLLKGLEADISVILNAADLNSRNLYVAMTRGSRGLVVCSPTAILRPRD